MAQEAITSLSKLFPEIIYDADQISELTLDIWNTYRLNILPKISNHTAFIKYEVKASDTLEGLARNFYANDRLWWLILFANNAEDPFSFLDDIRSGQTELENGKILILKPKYISDILLNLKRLKNVESRNAKNN